MNHGTSSARSQAGFTFVELLVAMGMTAFVLAAASLAFQLGTGTVRGGTDQAEAQGNARWALERMIQEIRGAGYDPTAVLPTFNFDAIGDQTATGLTLRSDFNGNGVIDVPGGCDPAAATERVGYRLVGSQLLRATDAPANTCEMPIIAGVTNLAFTYLDVDGNPPATAADIRTVVVALTVNSDSGGAGRAVAMTDRVRLRNR